MQHHDNLLRTRVFWGTFLAHLLVSSNNALTFRFADLISSLDGTEQTAGIVVSAGTSAALLTRLFLGQAIDQFGLRLIWLITGLCFFSGSVGFAFATEINPTLYIARILYAIGLAGAITGTNLHIQNQVPSHRRTEAIASVGCAGFLGLIVGSTLGDWIYRTTSADMRFPVLFGSGAAIAAAYLATILLLSRGERPPDHVPPASLRMLIRYQPFWVTLVALMMGLTFCVSMVFVTRFVSYRHLGDLSPFYSTYAVSAFVFRWLSRRWSQRLGRHGLISLGLFAHAAGLALLPQVQESWQLLIPAALIGIGFAFLFPAVVSLIAEAYPAHHRGTGTNIALGCIEVGTFISAPLLGRTILSYNGVGYEQAFGLCAAVITIVGILYTVVSRTHPDSDLQPEIQPVQSVTSR